MPIELLQSYATLKKKKGLMHLKLQQRILH